MSSVIIAPRIKRKYGTLKSMYVLLLLFAITLFIMGIWTSIQWVLIAAIIISGALLGNNNTLITTAVMNSPATNDSTTSAAYNFTRFIGSAIAPLLAASLGQYIGSEIPYLAGGLFVTAALIFLFLNRKTIIYIDN
nr:MFS transporter [Methanobrevibacter cuticularis]